MTESEKAFQLLQNEMVGVWTYLINYVELFGHEDAKRIRLIHETAPGFFTVVQASLAESMMMKLARLMDPSESRGSKQNKNMSFEQYFELGDGRLKHAFACFCAVKFEWKQWKYKPLNQYRNKLGAHNNLKSIQEYPLNVLTRLTEQHLSLLRELFQELWGVVAQIHKIIFNASLIEPCIQVEKAYPTQIFNYLKQGLFFEQIADDSVELFNQWSRFPFSEVGQEAPIQLIKAK